MSIGRNNGGRPLSSVIKNQPNRNGVQSGLGKNGPRNKSLPNKNKDGGRKGGKGLEATARRLANGVIRDEVRDLRDQNKEVNRAAENAIDTARFQYQRGLGDLEYIGGETSDYVKSLGDKTQAMYGQTSLAQNAAAAALQQQLGGIYDTGASAANTELERLGIGDGSDSFLQQMRSDQANASSVGAINSANAQSTLGAMQANSGAVSDLLGGMVQGSMLSNVGRNLNDRNDAFMDIRNEKQDQQALIRDAIKSARGSRQDVFFQLLQQLRQSGWGGKGR